MFYNAARFAPYKLFFFPLGLHEYFVPFYCVILVFPRSNVGYSTRA